VLAPDIAVAARLGLDVHLLDQAARLEPGALPTWVESVPDSQYLEAHRVMTHLLGGPVPQDRCPTCRRVLEPGQAIRANGLRTCIPCFENAAYVRGFSEACHRLGFDTDDAMAA
jgi:hypothetical protein